MYDIFNSLNFFVISQWNPPATTILLESFFCNFSTKISFLFIFVSKNLKKSLSFNKCNAKTNKSLDKYFFNRVEKYFLFSFKDK